MKKALLLVAALFCTVAITASAQTAPKKPATAEQKALRKQMIEKYDANKDGKLDKEEIAKISEADQKALKDAGVTLRGGPAKKAQ
jgi:hypothetical protein